MIVANTQLSENQTIEIKSLGCKITSTNSIHNIHYTIAYLWQQSHAGEYL
jgi:hypothetical protein